MVKVKVCGLTSTEDAEIVCNNGADFVGVIVDVKVPTSREISPAEAREILETVPDDVQKVVVTMPENLQELKDLEKKIDSDYFQIHSHLSDSQLREIGEEIGRKIIGVISVPQKSRGGGKTITRAKRIGEVTDLLLLDTNGGGGGTGKTHDWEISSKIGESLETPIILAGGLNPSNVKRAVEKVNPFAVDAASGLESEPGRKDPGLVRKFFDEVGEQVGSG